MGDSDCEPDAETLTDTVSLPDGENVADPLPDGDAEALTESVSDGDADNEAPIVANVFDGDKLTVSDTEPQEEGDPDAEPL